MLRYLAGVVSALLLVGAGVFLFRSSATTEAAITPMPRQAVAGETPPDAAENEPLPSASIRTREEKRFDRQDKDRDGAITRDEYLLNRRKAYAKLDTNGDGRLAFDEWSIKATTKFAGADADRSGTLIPTEFATTAVKRNPRARLRCPPQQAANESE